MLNEQFKNLADHEPKSLNGVFVNDRAVKTNSKCHPTGKIRMGDCFYVNHKMVIVNKKNSEFVGQDVFFDWDYFGNIQMDR